MKSNGGTALPAAVRLHAAAHPGQSGLHALPDGRDALAARLALADAAQRSLDVQYFIWNNDLAGKAEPEWQNRLTEIDLRALSSLRWRHVKSVGTFTLNIQDRLAPSRGRSSLALLCRNLGLRYLRAYIVDDQLSVCTAIRTRSTLKV
jgi:hypothetical protein